jgi:hypothetical protein
MNMKKNAVLISVVLIGLLMSCQKKYVCYCTNVNSGISVYKETYKGTSFAKKAAIKSCEKHMSTESDSLTNCLIK